MFYIERARVFYIGQMKGHRDVYIGERKDQRTEGKISEIYIDERKGQSVFYK